MSTGVRFAAVAPSHLQHDCTPAVETVVSRRPGHRGVISVSCGHDAARTRQPRHGLERADRVGEMLKHLVCVHDVERSRCEICGPEVTNEEGHVVDTPRPRAYAGLFYDVGRQVDADGAARRDPCRQVSGQGAGSAADVEQIHAGSQQRQEIGRRVLRGPPAMRAQNRIVVAVGVGLGGRHRTYRRITARRQPSLRSQDAAVLARPPPAPSTVAARGTPPSTTFDTAARRRSPALAAAARTARGPSGSAGGSTASSTAPAPGRGRTPQAPSLSRARARRWAQSP